MAFYDHVMLSFYTLFILDKFCRNCTYTHTHTLKVHWAAFFVLHSHAIL